MCEEDGIRRTLAQYSQYIDDRRADELAELFAVDGVWNQPSRNLKGREEIRGYAAGMQRPPRMLKHVAVNPIIDIDGDNATVSADFLLIEQTDVGGVITRAGRYRDRLVKEDGRWRFAERTHLTASWAPAGGTH